MYHLDYLYASVFMKIFRTQRSIAKSDIEELKE